MPHEGFNTIDEYTFDTLKLPDNCDSPEMKFNGLSSVTNSARNQHLESHETRTACLEENVCDNRGDPTKERNSFDPLNFTKGERPRLDEGQNRTHASYIAQCSSEIDGEGRQFKVVSSSSLSPSLHKRPTSGHIHQWYNSEPVTKSELHRLRTGDIACNSGGHSATTELLFARESEYVSNIRSFPLKDSTDNSRLREKSKSHLPVVDEYRYSVLGRRRCDATRLKRENRSEALNPIRPLFKDQSNTTINKPKCKSESGTDLAQQISGIHSRNWEQIIKIVILIYLF